MSERPTTIAQAYALAFVKAVKETNANREETTKRLSTPRNERAE